MDDILMWHWVNSEKRLERKSCEPGKSTNEIAIHLPAGVYTTMRTYQRQKVLRLNSHLQRLLESARMSGTSLNFDGKFLREIMRVAIESINFPGEIKIRIHIDLQQADGDIYFLLEPLLLPKEIELSTGATAVSHVMHRDNPLVKATGFITTAEILRKQIPDGVNEILMTTGEGAILEGLSSNFFAIRDDEVWTADEGVLAGITRDITLKSIGSLGIPIKYLAYPIGQVKFLDEAFITSTSRGVLSLREIDHTIIGTVCPGRTTIRIRNDFERQVNEEIEEI